MLLNNPSHDFPTEYAAILEQMANIDPIRYAKSRNFLKGAVTRLSPYLTHGVISTREVLEHILKTYSFREAEKLIFELAWRDFFQAVYSWHGGGIFRDLRQVQTPVVSQHLPNQVIEASTGIHGLDDCIQELYATGYMHNHARMWLASLVCNIARVHWREPAAWLYYHLLDGDLASNTLSWQWVAGSFSSKKYYANQANINKYSHSEQSNTVLDASYTELPERAVPIALKQGNALTLTTPLPQSTLHAVSTDKPVLLYHLWMLNPSWKAEVSEVSRVLILEPSFLKRHPMSQKRMDFILDLAKNIRGLELFVGELAELRGLEACSSLVTQAHPAISHWTIPKLKKEPQQSMFQPTLKDYKSFFAYWKACQKTASFKALL